jgi:hypothetical protein
VRPLPPSAASAPAPAWRVATARTDAASAVGTEDTADFDAVVVVNGHYAEANLPEDVDGWAAFPGAQLHSHSYRSPGPFAGQAVVVVGASNSGDDISREIATAASRVYLCARAWPPAADGSGQPASEAEARIVRRPMLSALSPDGRATFADGSASDGPVDAVVYCTGYRYRFPFLEGAGNLGVTSGEQVRAFRPPAVEGSAAQRCFTNPVPPRLAASGRRRPLAPPALCTPAVRATAVSPRLPAGTGAVAIVHWDPLEGTWLASGEARGRRRCCPPPPPMAPAQAARTDCSAASLPLSLRSSPFR